MKDKKELRTSIINCRMQVSPEQAAAAAQALLPHLLSLLSEPPLTIAAYAAMRGEIDPSPLLNHLHQAGYALALPCIVEKKQPLQFRCWQPGDALVGGAFGAECPADNAEIVTPDVVLCPVVGFDTRKNRLGYGGGFYDRTLAALKAKNPALKAYGLAFACQQVDEIPVDAHDIKMDAIITEQGIIH